MTWNRFLQWLIDCLEKMKSEENTFRKGTIQMKKEEKKTEKTANIPYMMNRELSWLKFNERVLNEAGNPRVPFFDNVLFMLVMATMMIPGEATIISNYLTVSRWGWLDSYKVLIIPYLTSAMGIFLFR